VLTQLEMVEVFQQGRVKAIQNNEVIFTMTVSFQKDEDGISHSIEMPKVPPP
jgi:Acyl-CoA thioesterase